MGVLAAHPRLIWTWPPRAAIGFGLVGELHRLWSSEVPLDKAFWGYAVMGGLAINLTTSLLCLVFVSAN